MHSLQMQWKLRSGALPLFVEMESIESEEISGGWNDPIQFLEVLL